MADGVEVRVCDEIAAWLESTAGLPTHSVLKYERPPAVLPDDCPLLIVWYQNKLYQPVTTHKFDNRALFGVSWQVSGVRRATSLRAAEEEGRENLNNVTKIEVAMRTLSVGGWPDGGVVPEAYDLIPASVDAEPPMSMETGLVRGYSMAVTVHITERS